MATNVKHYEFHTPSGKKLVTSGPVKPVDVDKLIAERDAWYEKNKHLLEGYSVAEYLAEKHRDAAKGLL